MPKTITLNSKTMIDFFGGKTQINQEEINEEIDMYYEEINPEEEAVVFEDLKKILGLEKSKIETIFAPENPEIIKGILKEAYTTVVLFIKDKEFFNKMKKTPINLSNNTMLSNSYFKKMDSEYDLFYNTKLYLSAFEKFDGIVDISDLDIFDKYIPKDIKLRIAVRGKEDIKQFLKYENSQKEMVIDVNNIKNLKGKYTKEKYPITLSIGDMSKLDVDQLKKIRKKYNIQNIEIRDVEHNIDTPKTKSEIYDIDTYIKLKEALDQITDGIDKNQSDIDKFTKVYYRIAKKIKYDVDDSEYAKSDGTEGKGNPDAHNLKGGLLENLSVCSGFSKILMQALKNVGIESTYIVGKRENSNCSHAWNQVKIDGVWYNTDITWDEIDIKDGISPNYCLQSDEEFLHEDYDKLRYSRCVNSSYNQEKLHNEIFPNLKAESEKSKEVALVEEKDNFLKKLFNKIKSRFANNKKEEVVNSANIYVQPKDDLRGILKTELNPVVKIQESNINISEKEKDNER